MPGSHKWGLYRNGSIGRTPVNDSERDQLLARLDERTCHLMRVMSNHLSHHWAVTVLAIGAIITAISTAILVLVRLWA